MAEYRRRFVPGGSFFFTVALLERKRDLLVSRIDSGTDLVAVPRAGSESGRPDMGGGSQPRCRGKPCHDAPPGGACRPQTAFDGPAALALAERCGPDVVLLDIGLPGMNGYEVARQLRAHPAGRNALIVALSGYGQPEDRERARGAGFDDHLAKPVDFDTLSQVLVSHRQSGPSQPESVGAAESMNGLWPDRG